MKLSLSLLERIRRDPTTLSNSISGFVGQMSRRRVLELAIRKYHKRGESPESALEYLRTKYEKHFGVDARLHETEDRLAEYVLTHQREQVLTIYAFHRTAISVEPDLTLTAEVPRIDIGREDGYAVWLFQYGRRGWRGELRMPLLQAHVAAKFGVPSDLVTVGTYDLIHATYEDTRYSTEELRAAEAEVRNLATAIRDSLDDT